jgi:hypothetical protein
MKIRTVSIIAVFTLILGMISVLGVAAADPVFTDYSIGKIAFSSVTEKDGNITGSFNKQTVVSGISITPNGSLSGLVEGTQDGVNWIKIWDINSITAKTDFGLIHGIYANYTDKAPLDASFTYAWKQLRITVTSPAVAAFSYELFGYETNLTGTTLSYDQSFGVNGVLAASYYKDDRYKNIGNHIIKQWGKGDVVSTLDGVIALTVKFTSPAVINGFAFAHRSGDTFYERWNNVKFQASVNGKDWVDLAALPANVKDTMTLGDLALVSITVDNSTEYLYARILSTTIISVGVLDVYALNAVAPETTAPVTTAPVTTAPATTAPVTTKAPVTTTVAPVTTKTPVTTATVTTTAPDTTAAETTPAGGGCKSIVGFAVLAVIIPAAVIIIRKKK